MAGKIPRLLLIPVQDLDPQLVRVLQNNFDNIRVLFEEIQTTGFSVSEGDVEFNDSDTGVILTSPNGTRWRVQVDNSGNLTTTSL